MSTDSLDGRARLEEHRRIWENKPALRRIYGVWFAQILGELPRGTAVLEIGAGPGFLGEYSRRARPDLRWTSSDLLPTPWNDVAGDATRLPFATASHDAVVGLDTLHHLPDPASLFAEAARVVRPGGRVLFIEPWVTPLSYPVYRWLHHEDCNGSIDEWAPFAGPKRKDAFDGNAAVPKSLVTRTDAARWRAFGFEPPRVERLNAFPYLLSLGFRTASLLPSSLVSPLLAVDRWLAPLAPLTGLRALMVWGRL